MSNYKTYDYVLPIYALPALINADVSGLEDQEIRAIDDFEQTVINRHGIGHWSKPNDDEHYFAHYNDIDGSLGNDCEDWQYIVFNR